MVVLNVKNLRDHDCFLELLLCSTPAGNTVARFLSFSQVQRMARTHIHYLYTCAPVLGGSFEVAGAKVPSLPLSSRLPCFFQQWSTRKRLDGSFCVRMCYCVEWVSGRLCAKGLVCVVALWAWWFSIQTNETDLLFSVTVCARDGCEVPRCPRIRSTIVAETRDTKIMPFESILNFTFQMLTKIIAD